jgi:hypothetical protein
MERVRESLSGYSKPLKYPSNAISRFGGTRTRMTRPGRYTSNSVNITECFTTLGTVPDCVNNGEGNEDSALFAMNSSRERRDGITITSTGEFMAATTTWKTGCYSTPTVTSRFTVLITPVRRCVLQWTFERLERLDGKLSRAVLRGRRGSNVPLLPGGVMPKTLITFGASVK